MNNIEIINSVLSKYQLDKHLPDSARKEILGMKKSILVNILKSSGKYTFFTAVIINAVLLAKKLGLEISAAKISVAVKAAVVITTSTAAITTGTVIYNHTQKSHETIQAATVQTVSSENKNAEPAVVETIPSYTFEIIPFTCPSDIAQESNDLQKEIHDSIIQKYGKQSAVMQQSTVNYHSKYILSGTFSRIGDRFYISVRVVNSSDSRIISIMNKTAGNTDDMKKIPAEVINELSGLKL